MSEKESPGIKEASRANQSGGLPLSAEDYSKGVSLEHSVQRYFIASR
jgi:hypothetical protein